MFNLCEKKVSFFLSILCLDISNLFLLPNIGMFPKKSKIGLTPVFIPCDDFLL